eukprot:scaffold4137_cov200-Alexandrium_tamarense.AAC.16
MDEFMDLDEQKDTDDNVGVKSKQPSSDNNAATPTYPKSFSKIPVELLLSEQTTEANGHDELLERYPLFQNARVAYCNLMEGDALYLPTSWFHEVSSSSQANEIDKGAHLALNYWFHPPSNPQSFRSPYSSDFWPKHWREKCLFTQFVAIFHTLFSHLSCEIIVTADRYVVSNQRLLVTRGEDFPLVSYGHYSSSMERLAAGFVKGYALDPGTNNLMAWRWECT